MLEAKLKLIPSPQHRALIALGYSDAFAAADHVPEILAFKPIGLEGFEGTIVDGLRKRARRTSSCFLRVAVSCWSNSGSTARMRRIKRRRGSWITSSGLPHPPSARLYTASEAKAVWRIRETGARSAAAAPGAPHEWEGWDDAAVAPDKLGAYLRDIRALLNEFNYRASFYGHFGHGCIHMRVTFDLESEAGIRKYGEFVDRAADLVVSYGGSLSGEHGDGQSRGALLPKMFGPS